MEESKPVIAIYDVRGIQNYIFKTNKVKEIVGASKIVDKLIINEFKNAINQEKIENTIIDWENAEKFEFDNNKNIQIEVLYYGGGNLVALFRTAELCSNVSIQMSINIMKKAYGLSLAYAMVEKTTDYKSDWKKLKLKLSNIKATTPTNEPAGILPVVQYDVITNQPLSKMYNGKKVSYEAHQKLVEFDNIKDDDMYMKQFDQMRTSDTEGLIAIVHIDGNSMGKNIGNIMKNTNTYEEAVNKMRKISNNIHKTFEVEAINNVKSNMESICKKHRIELKENKMPFRPLIQAGDDITFVCNARISLDIVKEYINTIKEKYMYDNNYKYSACGGIAIILML